jgi:alpha-beta hydrolase superfamily lysophospholipase
MDCGEDFVGERRDNQNPQQGFRDADILTHLDPKNAAPFFVAHGTADRSVSFEHSAELCRKMPGTCELLPIPGADHMFEGPGEMDMAYDGICKFLAAKTGEGSTPHMATLRRTGDDH